MIGRKAFFNNLSHLPTAEDYGILYIVHQFLLYVTDFPTLKAGREDNVSLTTLSRYF